MSNDPGSDPGASSGSQGDPGSQPSGGAPAPVTINAEMLGEYKDDATLKTFDGKPLADVFKWAANASKLIGGEKVVLPNGKLNTPENWGQVFDKLGRPKDASGYKFEKPADIPEGMQYNEALVGDFAKVSHFLGLLPWQAAGVLDFYNKTQISGYKDEEARQIQIAEETEAALMGELGTKQKYDEFVSGAQAALRKFGGDSETVGAFIDKFGNDPVALKVFGNVAKNMMEDAAVRGDKAFSLMGENAPAMVKDIMQNKSNALYDAYWQAGHPQHAHAVAEVARLNEVIYGDKAVTA